MTCMNINYYPTTKDSATVKLTTITACFESQGYSFEHKLDSFRLCLTWQLQ